MTPPRAEARKRKDEMLTPQEQEGRNTAEGTEETKQAAKTPVAKKDSPVVKKVSPDAKKAASAAKSSA